jgi:hypothetical protein
MRRAVARAMEATTDALIAVWRVVHGLGGIFSLHVHGEGLSVIRPFLGAIEVGELFEGPPWRPPA